jgi:hypothetical protein
MKVLVKNNRLALEASVKRLSDLDDAKLAQLAARYQIGSQRAVKKPVEVVRKGRVLEEERLSYERKPRAILENELRKYLSITIDIPKEHWTDDQSYFWQSNNVEEKDDINEINRLKEEMGILAELPPFEEGKDNLSTSRLLCELTEPQWEWVSEHNNFKMEYEKDEETKTRTAKRVHVHKLMVHEWVPEDDSDVERLKGMADTVAVKLSKGKYVKESKTK